ncbi:polysaccharide biosynthesis tyrosine autokinase [Geodermatophilus sp. SYSU D00705]
MRLSEYLRVLREQWLIIVLGVLLGTGAATAVWHSTPPQYTTFLTMYVSAQSSSSADSAYSAGLLSAQRVTSYVELASSERVAAEVVDRLGLDETPGQVASQITASNSPDTVLIYVTVTGTSPDDVTAIANTVGEVVSDLVDDLEAPTVSGGATPVAVRVVEPAALPSSPSSTSLTTALTFGFLAGLAVGVGAAFTRNALDTSVKSPEQLRELVRAPNLGIIGFDPKVPKRPLTVHEDPQSPRSEAFRQLRTNLQFVDVDEPRRVILVTSSLAEEGKTTTLCNLAIAIASTGSRVLVIEADLRRPRAADLLGLERSVGLTSVLVGQVEVDQAIQPWSGGLFDVLGSGPLPPNPSELLASKQMKTLLSSLRDRYDVVLIDAPPLLPVTDAAALAPATDGVLLVCRHQRTATTQVATAAQALEAVSAHVIGTVLTMVPRRGPHAYAQYNSYYQRDHKHEKDGAILALSSGPVVNRTGRHETTEGASPEAPSASRPT